MQSWPGISRDPACDQTGLAGIVVPKHDQYLGAGWMGKQIGLDVSGFDAETAQLDLLIDTAKERQGAIGIPGGEIPGFLETSCGAG
jgi:hypothetical protein